MARFWYSYDTVNDPYLTTSYRKQSSRPGCLNGQAICSIYAPAGALFPSILSTNIRQYITDGLANNVAAPATPPGAKFYVYLKNSSR